MVSFEGYMIRLTSIYYFGVFCILLIFSEIGLSHADYSICWPFNLVPYAIKPGFSIYQQNHIKQQVDKIIKSTCLYWIDMDESPGIQNLTSFVRFERETSGSCQTQSVYPGGGDVINVLIKLPDHCFEGGYVLHEILHALGFNHEQQRIDRDCYVWVSERVKKSFSFETSSFYTGIIPNIDRFPYDKESITHYRRSSDLKALSERFYEWEPLGNVGDRLTDLDVWKIQYRFCGRPHYCDVHPQHCRDMEQKESEKNCTVQSSI